MDYSKPIRFRSGEIYTNIRILLVTDLYVHYSYEYENHYYEHSSLKKYFEKQFENIPPKVIKHKGWINIFPISSSEAYTGGRVYNTEEEAIDKRNRGYNIHVTKEIEWETTE
jgi:hypothetical protein